MDEAKSTVDHEAFVAISKGGLPRVSLGMTVDCAGQFVKSARVSLDTNLFG